MTSSRLISESDVQRVAYDNPDLMAHGWRTTGDATALQITPELLSSVQIACDYLTVHPVPESRNSYALKHHIERWEREARRNPYEHVGNTAAIIAAILSG